MPKLHISQAPPDIKKDVETWAAREARTSTRFSPATAQARSLTRWIHHEFFMRESDLQFPATEALKKAEAATRAPGLKHIPASVVKELQWLRKEAAREAETLTRVRGLAKWATEPTRAEIGEAERIQREAEAKERAIENRAQELLAADQSKALQKARIAAQKELSHAN